MFIWNGYVQVSLMLYSLKIIKLHNWIINFVSPLEAVPECPFQSAVLRALQAGKLKEEKNRKQTENSNSVLGEKMSRD